MEAATPPPAPPLAKKYAQLTCDPYLRRISAKLLAYVNVFVDDILGLEQGPRHHRRHVRRTLFHTLDEVFRPLNRQDSKQRKEVLSIKNMDAGDCSWSTCQTLIGWIVDSINMTITLLLRQVARLKVILSSIPRSQRRIGVAKWHRVLGEIGSMALALHGSRGLFIQIQESLCHFKGKRVTLSKGVHEALADLCWLAEDVSNRPTRIYKIVPLRTTVDGNHNASGYMCGDMVLPGPMSIPRILLPHPSAARPPPNPIAAYPIVWRTPLTKNVVDSLVSWTNPKGTVNNSEL